MGYKNEAMHSLFATTSPEEHQRLKRSVAQKYSMTAMRGLEYLVDPCSTIFIDAMKDLQGEVVDLGAWLQWYAFDVVGAMSFSRRYGFMEERKDVHNVIAGIDSGLLYPALVGQVPWLHKFLFGNPTVRSMLEALIGGGKSPIPIVTKVSIPNRCTVTRFFTIRSKTNWQMRWSRIVSKSPTPKLPIHLTDQISCPTYRNKKRKLWVE